VRLIFYFQERAERKIWNLIARGAFEAFSPAGNGWSRLKTQEMEIEGKGCAMYPNVPMATMIMMRLLLRNNFLSPHQQESGRIFIIHTGGECGAGVELLGWGDVTQ